MADHRPRVLCFTNSVPTQSMLRMFIVAISDVPDESGGNRSKKNVVLSTLQPVVPWFDNKCLELSSKNGLTPRAAQSSLIAKSPQCRRLLFSGLLIPESRDPTQAAVTFSTEFTRFLDVVFLFPDFSSFPNPTAQIPCRSTLSFFFFRHHFVRMSKAN